MIVLPGFVDIDLHIVTVVHLLQDVPVDLGCNVRFVTHLVVQGCNSLGGSVLMFTKFEEVLVVDVLDGDYVVDGVHSGVLHDFLDPFLLGQLVELVTVGRVRELLR